MNIKDFPQPGSFSGAQQLYAATFKAISFLQIGAVYNKGENQDAIQLKKFFLECAAIVDDMCPKEEIVETKTKKGK
jgi:hypothetical protein